MPSKSTSPEAAQKKVWKAEIKTHEQARRKVRADFRNEQKQLIRNCEAADKALNRFMVRVEKELPKQEAEIDKRIAILKGRLGL